MNKKNTTIVIDPGHGGSDPGAVGRRLKEKNVALKISLILHEALEKKGFKTLMTRSADTYPGLEARARLANSHKADLFISIHTNGHGNPTANGIETLVYADSGENGKIAAHIQNSLIAETGRVNRGIKERPDLLVLRKTTMTAVLVETGFITNEEEELLFMSEAYLQRIGNAICHGVDAYYTEAYSHDLQASDTEAPKGVGIVGPATATAEQARQWAKSKNATEQFQKLAPCYWIDCKAAGINPAIAYCQAAKETGYGHFRGVLEESHCNPCGLKTKEGGEDKAQSAHQRFNSWEEGIAAHVDHLALYAGAKGYPAPLTHDPRHFPSLFGKCPTVESLSGQWATDPEYGQALVKMLRALEATQAVGPEEEKNRGMEVWQSEGLKWITNQGIITDPVYWDSRPATRADIVGLLGKVASYITDNE